MARSVTFIHSPRVALGAALALALAACGDASGDAGGRPGGGYLGSGSTEPECGALGQACLQIGLDAPLAKGASMEFLVDFRLAGSSGPAVALESAVPGVLEVEGNLVRAKAAGMSGLLFVGDDERLLDFLHVWVAQADELRILAYSRQGDLLGPVQDTVTLLVGDEVLVSVEPFLNAQSLLGNFPLERTLTGTAVIMIPDAVGGLYRVIAREAGTATVVVRGVGVEASWQIEVLP